MTVDIPVWLRNAARDIGVHEVVGAKHNPAVVQMFADAGFSGVKDDETAWCAAFVGAKLRLSGFKSSGSLWALDYAKYGSRLPGPLVGSIATKERKGKTGKVIGGHVFFVVGWTDETVWGLGGNQNNAVSVAQFRRRELKAFTWPPGAARPADFRRFQVAVYGDHGAVAGVSEA